METGSHELVILSYATVCLHPSVSLNNETNCREISKDKIAVCEKTAGLRSENSSDLDSACLKGLGPVELFQFSDMHYESRFLDTFRGDNIRPIIDEFNVLRQQPEITRNAVRHMQKQAILWVERNREHVEGHGPYL